MFANQANMTLYELILSGVCYHRKLTNLKQHHSVAGVVAEGQALSVLLLCPHSVIDMPTAGRRGRWQHPACPKSESFTGGQDRVPSN